MSFWGELKRRNVFKVGAAYLIAAWLILQVASITFPALNLPEWTLTFVTVLLIIGFLIAIILAWAYEVTPDGVKPTKQVPLADSITHVTGRKLDYILGALLVIAVGYIVIDKIFISREPVDTEVTLPIAEQSAPATEVKEESKTIAVLPFADLSPEKDQEYFVDGLTEEILNSLAQIPDLGVTARTSSFSFKDTNKTVQEIASVLSVENVLEGSVRKAGDSLRITTQLIRAKDGLHIWSNTYDKKLKDIFEVQEDIATSVANELKVRLGVGESFRQLGGTDNVEAYEHYLVALGQLSGTMAGDPLESIDTAIELDRKFASAWVLKAVYQEIIAVHSPPNQAATEYEKALITAQKAIEIEPHLPEAYASLGSIKSAKGEWIEAEQAFSKAIELTGSPTMLEVYCMHLFAVGNFEKAEKFLRIALRSDPLNYMDRFNYIISFALLGDKQQVEREIEHTKEVLGIQGFSEFIAQAHLGLGDYVPNDDISAMFNRYGNVEIDLHYPENGIVELNRFLDDNIDISIAYLNDAALIAANLGDLDFTMKIIEKSAGLSPKAIFFAWFPVMHDVRQLPRFKEYVRELGLVDYWNQFGWPDICRPLDNGDFVCE